MVCDTLGTQAGQRGKLLYSAAAKGTKHYVVETHEQQTLNFINTEGYEMFAVTFKVEDAQALHSKLKEQGLEVGECNNDGNRIRLWGGFPQA